MFHFEIQSDDDVKLLHTSVIQKGLQRLFVCVCVMWNSLVFRYFQLAPLYHSIG
jgi:hypothetical protein